MHPSDRHRPTRPPSAGAARRRSTRVTLAIAVAITAAAGSTTAGARSNDRTPDSVATAHPASAAVRLDPPSVDGLAVMLTNDDGVQPAAGAEGLFELRRALCAAGADVVVVAPWLDRSGASASITYGSPDTRFTLDTPVIEERYANDCAGAPSGGAVWGGCVTPAGAPPTCAPTSPSLTPADAVTLGATAAVQHLHGWAEGPDVIISGTNRGGNDGLNVNISGTLGAATIGSSLGYPSIAISASSSGGAAVVANTYAAAADWAVGFVGTLAANDLLPADYVVSVNYPRTDRAPITDAVWTDVAQLSPFATGYVANGTSFESVFAFCQGGPRCGDPEPGSDSAVYSSGRIAITPIAVDRTVGAAAEVATLRAVVQAGAVSPVPPERPGNKPIVVPPGRGGR